MMRILNFILPAKPNHDDVLHGLLNHKPWDWDGGRVNYNDESVLKILRRNPGAAMVKYEFKVNGRGTTKLYPLFRIISLGGSLKTLRTCHRAFPEALSAARTDVGANALHVACTFKSDAGIVKWIHRKDPTLVRMTNTRRFTPLGLACGYGSSAEVVRLLVKWYPGAMDVTNALGETPHASAVNNGASEEVFKVLGSAPSSSDDGCTTNTGNSSASVPPDLDGMTTGY